MSVLWRKVCQRDGRAMSGRTGDLDGSLERMDAFADALKAEMPLADAGSAGRVESAAVVGD